MSVVAFHGDRTSDGRALGRPRLALAGSERDPATAVQLARKLMLSDAWKTVPLSSDDPVDRAVYLLRARLPVALTVLNRAAVGALTRAVPLNGCSWCVARFFSAASLGEDPEPEVNAFTRAYLGAECAGCRRQHAARDAIGEVVERFTTLTAAGVPPASAARARDDRSARWLLAAAQGQAPTLPPAPTGVIWTGAQPPAVTAALRPPGRRPRKIPAPSYYLPMTQAAKELRAARAAAEDREAHQRQLDADAAFQASAERIVAAHRAERQR